MSESGGFVPSSNPVATVDGYGLERGKPLTLRFRMRVADMPIGETP